MVSTGALKVGIAICSLGNCILNRKL